MSSSAAARCCGCKISPKASSAYRAPGRSPPIIIPLSFARMARKRRSGRRPVTGSARSFLRSIRERSSKPGPTTISKSEAVSPILCDGIKPAILTCRWSGTTLSMKLAGAESSRSQAGRFLYVRARCARNVLHVPAVRAHVRAQQPARQFEHVPRKHLRWSAGEHRRASGHGHS